MGNATPILEFVYNRYGKATARKDAVVELRITYMRKQKYMSTGVRLLPKEWRNGRVINRVDAVILNKTLDKFMIDVRYILYDMIEKGQIDIFAIPYKLYAKKVAADTFYAYCEARIEVRKYGKALDTQQRYDRFLRFLKEYDKIKTFDDLKEAKIMELDKYLASKKLKAKSRWFNYHRFLNSFILDAQKEHIIERNPYDSVRIDHGEDYEGIERYLTKEEFIKLRKATMPSERLERVRDLFVFHCYSCLAYHDLQKFDSSKIQEKKGKRFYIGHRGKTNIEYTIPILGEAQAILDKYEGKLPLISNVKYNAYLKEVMAVAGIDKPVTTHWARHTGATLLLNAGVPMQTVSKICGHSTIKMTERIYAKMFPETVVDAVYKIEDKLK